MEPHTTALGVRLLDGWLFRPLPEFLGPSPFCLLHPLFDELGRLWVGAMLRRGARRHVIDARLLLNGIELGPTRFDQPLHPGLAFLELGIGKDL